MNITLTRAVALLAGLTRQSAFAVTDTVTINVVGILTSPPCTVTSSKTLNVDFGSLRYDQIASAPVVTVPVTLTCPNNSSLSFSVKSPLPYQVQPLRPARTKTT